LAEKKKKRERSWAPVEKKKKKEATFGTAARPFAFIYTAEGKEKKGKKATRKAGLVLGGKRGRKERGDSLSESLSEKRCRKKNTVRPRGRRGGKEEVPTFNPPAPKIIYSEEPRKEKKRVFRK